MSNPHIVGSASVSAPYNNAVSAGVTPGMSVSTGDSVFVFIGYSAGVSGGTPVQSVTDSQSNSYRRAGRIENTGHASAPNPSVDIWYADGVSANSALTVTVTFGGPTLFSIFAVDIAGAAFGSLDAVTSGAIGTGTTSSDSVPTVDANDLIIACQCTVYEGGPQSSSSGFSNVFSGSSGTNSSEDVRIDGWSYGPVATGSYNSSLSWGTSAPFAILTIAIKAPLPWSELKGRPFIMVSPSGVVNGLSSVRNDGSDFGPDTSGTVTSGIQEALNSLPTTGGYVYLRRGTYTLTSSLVQSGNNQTVFFEPGCTLSFGSGATLLQQGSNGNSFVILVGANADSSSMQNYSHCRWYGNGCVILQNGLAGSTTTNTIHINNWGLNDSSSPPSPSLDIEVDDFVIEGVSNTSFWIGVGNYQGGLTYLQEIRNVRVSKINATWYEHVTGASGFVIQGSAAQIVLEDLFLDTSAVPSIDYSNCFMRSNAGDCQEIVVRRSTFRQNGSTGSVLELQGNSSSINPSQRRDLHDVLIEDCIFDSGASSGSPVGGLGGGYIDDNNSTGSVGFIYNVMFRRCQFVHVGVKFQSSGTQFGYLRFAEGGQPGLFSGSLAGRGPADPGVAISGSSPLTYTNADGFDERIVISGGTISAISINGKPTVTTQGVFVLRSGDSISVTYSGTTTLTKQAF